MLPNMTMIDNFWCNNSLSYPQFH